MEAVLTSIKTHADGLKLWGTVEKLPRKDVIAWHDSQNFDFLHHAIIHNNVIAVGAFLAHGYFKSTVAQESNRYPYPHVASLLGHKSILTMFLEEPQFGGHNLHKSDLTNLCKTLNVAQVNNSVEEMYDLAENISVLDVASLAGHVGCVKTILNFYQLMCMRYKHSADFDYYYLACRQNSPSALKLLLQEHTGKASLEEAFKTSLVKMRDRCLDVLLRHGVETDSFYRGMNLFHVLYSYIYAVEVEQFDRIFKMTALLLKHGFDVRACTPSRTYPLYSFIYQYVGRSDIDEDKQAIVLKSLRLLLKAGADPNYDEILKETENQDDIFVTAYGREAFSSALHAFMAHYFLNSLNQVDQNYSDFFYKVCELLLQQGADPNYRARYLDVKESKITAFQAAVVCSLGIGKGTDIVRLFLKYGANPNSVDFSFTFLLHYSPLQMTNEADVLEIFAILLNTMSHVKHLTSLKEFLAHPATAAYPVSVIRTLQEKLTTVWSLKRSCGIRIFNFCGRSPTKVNTLPVPETIKIQICPFLK